jgi:3-phenylpropionate/trans-cinnamate dioxygenase ferredoxin reductase component
MRIEHRLNATEQGMAVAAGILGDLRPFAPIPYFWSDQYDARIQAYGTFPEHADVTIVHGSPEDRRFVAAYGHEGKVVGVLGWNSHRELRTLPSSTTPRSRQARRSREAGAVKDDPMCRWAPRS